MNFLDEHAGGFAEFPYPANEEPLPADDEMSVGEKASVKAPCKKWLLTAIRGNDGFDNDRFVINLNLKGDEPEYAYAGSADYWFGPRDFENPKNPAWQKAARLGKLFVELGISNPGQWPAGIGFKEIKDNLVSAAKRELKGKHVVKGSLKWSKRKYATKDGEERVFNELEFTPYGLDAQDDGSAPF